jgi:hypothetical protein
MKYEYRKTEHTYQVTAYRKRQNNEERKELWQTLYHLNIWLETLRTIIINNNHRSCATYTHVLKRFRYLLLMWHHGTLYYQNSTLAPRRCSFHLEWIAGFPDLGITGYSDWRIIGYPAWGLQAILIEDYRKSWLNITGYPDWGLQALLT